MRLLPTLSGIALVLLAAPAVAETELSFYLGAQTAPHSRIEGENVGGTFSELIGWEGRSGEAPPYYGIRATWWTSDTMGYGVELNHAKVYAPDDEAAAAGFDNFEFTDGLNIVTVNAFRRWPSQWGAVTPYVGGGVGLAIPHVDVEDGTNTTFEYQITGPAVMLTAGAKYEINDQWGVFGEYKFTYSSNEAELDGGGSVETDILTNALNVGGSCSVLGAYSV
jgi:lipid A oxidase